MGAVEARPGPRREVWPQVQTRPIDISFTLDQRSLMLLSMPSWWKVASIRDRAEKLAAVADRGATRWSPRWTRSRRGRGGGLGAGGFVVRDVVHERNNDLVGRSSTTSPATAARSHGEHDHRPRRSTRTSARGSSAERSATTTRPSSATLLAHPYVHVGASPTAAPTSARSRRSVTPGSCSRDSCAAPSRSRLEAAVKKITLDPATIWGLKGRGLLAAGNAADVVVFDADNIDRGPEDRLRRLPRRRRPLDPSPGGRRHGRGQRRGHLERRRRLCRRCPRRADRHASVSELPPVAGHTWSGRRRPGPLRRGRRRSAGPARPRLSRVVVLVAPPAAGARRGRLPSGGDRRARLRPLVEAAAGRGLPHGAPRRRQRRPRGARWDSRRPSSSATTGVRRSRGTPRCCGPTCSPRSPGCRCRSPRRRTCVRPR